MDHYSYFVLDFDLVVVITGPIPDSEFVVPQQLIRDYLIPTVGEISIV